MANTANTNPIIAARLNDNNVQNFFATTAKSGNRPTGFIRVYDYCPVDVTAAILAECGVSFYRPSQQLSTAQINFLEKFFDVNLGNEEEANKARLPMWVLVHKTHGVVGYFKPNLGVTAETHTFKQDLEKEATVFVKKEFLPKGSTFQEGQRYSRYSEE